MARVLIIEGAGFIGSHLVDWLMMEGFDIVVLDNFYNGRLFRV
jgi:UDP-glucuronate decarboxylase